MKKTILFVAALFAAVMVNAKEISVDLSKATEMSYDGCSATFAYADDVLTINYNVTGWAWAGIEIDLDNLTDVVSIDFDLKGNGNEVAMIPYLRDVEGNRWAQNAGEEAPVLTETDWIDAISQKPDKAMWDAPTYPYGEKAFNKVGFIANLSEGTGTFQLRNVKIVTAGGATAVENVESQTKAVKVVRNGQILILRDGKTFNALGAEVK